ncbi:MAG: cation transporter [Deltaproteobacteria bacterium]|nr:cation transporter [Deltaproteobacteria bacterium]
MGQADNVKKIGAARFSVGAALGLAVLKLTTGFLLHSLGMISAGVDSLMDLIASGINYFSMKQAIKPADREHPYGHGKIENIASLFQAGIIGLAGLLLMGEGIRRMLLVEAVPVFDVGIFVMALSGVISYLVGRRLARFARMTDSPLLAADALHFTIDTWTNTGVVLALLLSRWSGKIFFDRAAAILIGGWILYAALKLFRNALAALMDQNISPEMEEKIDRIILDHCEEIIGYHRMRTRRSGSKKMIDLHLVICKDITLDEAHGITEELEKKIEEDINNSDVMIHIEPCDMECPRIREQCLYKTEPSSPADGS